MEQRLVELELSFMQQERTIQELNEIVTRQELEIETLKRHVALIKEQLVTIAPSLSRSPDQEEPPPHY